MQAEHFRTSQLDHLNTTYHGMHFEFRSRPFASPNAAHATPDRSPEASK